MSIPGVSYEWQQLQDPWAITGWHNDFARRGGLRRELALLAQIFSEPWRAEFVAKTPFEHALPYHLASLGGQARLLGLAAELLRIAGSGEAGAKQVVAVRGRLRTPSLYLPTLCEIVVAPILRALGKVSWQPQRHGHGADYQVECDDGILVAEVKRVCTSRRQEALGAGKTTAFLATARAGEMIPMFTDAEELANLREGARRLYPHVRHAARQLERSAQLAAEQWRSGRGTPRMATFIPGMLLLDLDGNSSLRNLGPRIVRWMQYNWATPIDLVAFVDYESWDAGWGMTVEMVYSRTDVALHRLAGTLGGSTGWQYGTLLQPRLVCRVNKEPLGVRRRPGHSPPRWGSSGV